MTDQTEAGAETATGTDTAAPGAPLTPETAQPTIEQAVPETDPVQSESSVNAAQTAASTPDDTTETASDESSDQQSPAAPASSTALADLHAAALALYRAAEHVLAEDLLRPAYAALETARLHIEGGEG